MIPADPSGTDFQAGAHILIDKPITWTSFDVVNKLRYALQVKKIGHAGTLDPLATGLLILCSGKFTKKLNELQGLDKEYEAVIKFGATTASYDAEFPEENVQDASHLTPAAIEAAMADFRGLITQVPPAFSAVKIKGKPAYKAARKGQDIQLKSREVTIHAFELLNQADLGPQAYAVRIHCSKGTYIRSLAHDLGQALGVGGYLQGLRRTRIGEYHLDDAWSLPDFLEALPPRT